MADEITDICGSLSRMCQALVHGWPLRFKWLHHNFQAEEAFAEDKFFPLFLHMAMRQSPNDPALRCAQFADRSNPLLLGAVVPSYREPSHEEKWEMRLRKIIDSYKPRAFSSGEPIDLSNLVPNFSVDTYGDDIPTFHDVAEALQYFHEQDVMKMCGELDETFAALEEMVLGSAEWVREYQYLKTRISRRRLPDETQKAYEDRFKELPVLTPAEVLRIHTDLVDLTDKLSEDCKIMASSSPVRYRIQGEMLTIDEAFAMDGMLPVFLFLAKEMNGEDEEMQFYHYPDNKALLNQRVIAFAEPGADAYLKWKQALFGVISSMEESAKGSDGVAELDRHYLGWAEYVRDKNDFWRWYAEFR